MLARQRDSLVHHFRASAEAGFVNLRWRTAEPCGLHYRLLRSERSYPASFDPPTADLLWEGTDTGYQDRGAAGRRRYFYVLQAQGLGGLWLEQARARVKAKFGAVDRAAIEAANVATGAYDAHPNR
jgi:hypothetical protein